jgi:hypothetical protein
MARPVIPINERLAVNMRRGGFKIRHIAQTLGVSTHKIGTTLARYPEAVPCYDTADKTRAAFVARMARVPRRTVLAWLPDAYAVEYSRLRKAFGASDAKRIIRDQIARDKNSGSRPSPLAGVLHSPVERPSWGVSSQNLAGAPAPVLSGGEA